MLHSLKVTDAGLIERGGYSFAVITLTADNDDSTAGFLTIKIETPIRFQPDEAIVAGLRRASAAALKALDLTPLKAL